MPGPMWCPRASSDSEEEGKPSFSRVPQSQLRSGGPNEEPLSGVRVRIPDEDTPVRGRSGAAASSQLTHDSVTSRAVARPNPSDPASESKYDQHSVRVRHRSSATRSLEGAHIARQRLRDGHPRHRPRTWWIGIFIAATQLGGRPGAAPPWRQRPSRVKRPGHTPAAARNGLPGRSCPQSGVTVGRGDQWRRRIGRTRAHRTRAASGRRLHAPDCCPTPRVSRRRRCPPLERIAHSGPLEVTQDRIDDVGLHDHGDDLHLGAARGAKEGIDLEDAARRAPRERLAYQP